MNTWANVPYKTEHTLGNAIIKYNKILNLLYYCITVNDSVTNQATIVTLTLPKDISDQRMSGIGVCKEDMSINVNLRPNGTLISSHSIDSTATQPKYMGIVALI